MTDELDRLAAAFKDTPGPEPRPAARASAVAAALAAFDAAAEDPGAAASQGSERGRRQRGDRARGPGSNRWRAPMPIRRPRPLRAVLAGTAGLATVALALFVVTQTDLGRDAPTTLTAPSDGGAETSELRSQAATGAAPEADLVADEASEVTRDLARVDAAAPERGSGAVTASQLAPRAGLDAADAGQARTRSVFVPSDRGRAEANRESLAAQPLTVAPAAPNAASRPSAALGLAADARAPTEGFAAAPQPEIAPAPAVRDEGRDRFDAFEENPVKVTAEDPVSTFSIDVDTASYSFVRQALERGVLPPMDAVRVEELINYFAYDYPVPETAETPFRADLAILPTPWNPGTKLLRIGLRGYEIAPAERPRANLVFLIDTSGSMQSEDKLPLLVASFRLLLERLGAEDRVAIVAYAGSAGTVLEPTPASERGRILAALERLRAGGSTAGGEGIRQAYALAEANRIEGGVNRVILATDGDFNVGIQQIDELEGFVARKRETGVLLSVFGFGRGNYNDAMMQALAQSGNGQAAYIDTLSEARKVLVDEATSTLFPIARDVKIQVEFNPATVAEYRLIGYETRALRREDFRNDAVDAGEIGSGHRVTALYEITPTGSEARLTEPLRYGAPAPEAEASADPHAGEYAFLRIRHKPADAGPDAASRLTEVPIPRALDGETGETSLREARFAAAVAGFGQLLRGGRHTGDWDFADAAALATGAKGPDPFGYRAEFVQLVRLAQSAAALERQAPR